MCVEGQLNSLIQKMVDIYVSVYGADIRSVYLYGSYARGDHDEQSDIDFAAIVDGNRSDLQKQMKKVWDRSSDLSMDYDVVVSPVVIPYDEFTHYKEKLPYYQSIIREGHLVG